MRAPLARGRAAAAIVPAIVVAILLILPTAALSQSPVPMPPLCPSGQNLTGTLFFDDMEDTASTLNNWTISTISGVNHWYYPPPPQFRIPFSGALNLWGRDDTNPGDSVIGMTNSVAIPAGGAHLQFNHSYAFESDGRHLFDGGVIEYSTDGGTSWLDAGSLITAGATYGGTLNANFSNPLAGRSAFVNDSFGYTASQLNLTSLAGQSVRLRFRIGTDETLDDTGWFIDDVRIYQCSGDVRPTHDFNGDGKADILWRHSSGLLYTWFMDGTTLTSSVPVASVDPSWTVQGVGDFNGDGKSDILWRHSSGLVYIWTMNGATTASAGSPGSAGTDWTIQAVGDFNGDGKADILWRHSSGLLYVWLMNGTSIIAAGSPGTAPADSTVAGVADIDGDGKADIVWRTSAGAVSAWLMDGTTLRSSGPIASVGPDWTIGAIADFNGDSKADLLWVHSSGLVYIWLLNGTSVTTQSSPGSVGPGWTIRSAVDFNGDGKADLLWVHSSGLIYVWLMNGASISTAGSVGTVGPGWVVQ